MFGNVLNNSQIKIACKRKDIEIRPFDASKLNLAHYPLTVAGVRWFGDISRNGKRTSELRANFQTDSEYVFDQNEYAIAEINEYLRLDEGIVGHFIPSSGLIEQGFGLTAGKIDPGYGSVSGETQKIYFGLKNLKSSKNVLIANQKIAHIYFVDLRGLNNDGFSFSPEQLRLISERVARNLYAADAGPIYPDSDKD
jgi:deoxycytidine triphosphate deaminase